MTWHHDACISHKYAGHSTFIIIVVLALCLRAEQILALGQFANGLKNNCIIYSEILV